MRKVEFLWEARRGRQGSESLFLQDHLKGKESQLNVSTSPVEGGGFSGQTPAVWARIHVLGTVGGGENTQPARLL